MKPDGLPMLTGWMSTAQSIWGIKYEAWREPFEFKAVDGGPQGGQPLDWASLEVVKGFGRMSVLLFSLLYSYINFKNQLSPEETDSLKEFPSCNEITGFQTKQISHRNIWGDIWVVFGHSKFQNFQR